MADNDAAYADLLPALSPLDDPDAAMLDRKATMAKLLGTDGPTAPPSWLDQMKAAQQSTPDSTDEVAQNDAPANLSPNGNALPPGLNSRVSSPSAAPAPVPASVTQSGTPSLADGNAATIGKMQSDYAKASQDVQNEANQPDISASTKNLEAARQNAAQPINAYDPKTGKLLDDYKPSFGQRLMRGVSGFAKGGIFGAVDPAIGGGTAYGAPNAQYGRDVEQQQGRVASLDQQLKNASDNWKATNDRLKQVATDRRALATMGKDVTGASIDQQGIPIKQQEADTGSQNADSTTAEAYNKSPAAKAATTAAEFTAAQKQADQLGLKGTNRTLFLANGKIPDPRQATDEEIATHQATQIFTQQNGHPPQTLEEFNEVRRAAKGADKQLGANGQPLSTTADKNRASLAHIAGKNLDQVEDIVNRRPEIIGKIGGQISQASDLIGSDDPDLVALGNAVHNFAMANAGIHGSRSHENVVDAEKQLINNMKSGPNGIRGGIRENRQNLDEIIQRVEGGKGSSSGSAGHDIVVNPEDMK